MGYIKKGKTYPKAKEQLKEIQDFFNTESPIEEKFFIEYSMDIAVEVDKQLKKQGLTQKDFAKKLNKRESEVSKWLSGLHNLTLRSIAKMSEVLNKKLILTASDAEEQFGNKAKVINFSTYKVEESPKIEYHHRKRSKKHIQVSNF